MIRASFSALAIHHACAGFLLLLLYLSVSSARSGSPCSPASPPAGSARKRFLIAPSQPQQLLVSPGCALLIDQSLPPSLPLPLPPAALCPPSAGRCSNVTLDPLASRSFFGGPHPPFPAKKKATRRSRDLRNFLESYTTDREREREREREDRQNKGLHETLSELN